MTETLSQKQFRFLQMESKLLAKAAEIAKREGIYVTGGDAFRDPRLHGEMGVKMGYGAANSCHKLKLARDLNFVDGKGYRNEFHNEFHNELHDYWDSIGGATRIVGDMNHFSLEHQGHR
jgi:hypothetical protein